jgi:hypothetical protein
MVKATTIASLALVACALSSVLTLSDAKAEDPFGVDRVPRTKPIGLDSASRSGTVRNRVNWATVLRNQSIRDRHRNRYQPPWNR